MNVSGAVVGVVAFVGVTAAAVLWGPSLHTDAPVASDDPANWCTVTVDGGAQYGLSPEGANNAALIAGVAFQRGYGVNGVTVALATAIQESGLRNLDYGDRDSLGLFQQRPSQGWGTEAQVTDPYYATNVFLDVLARVDGWESMRVTDAAQAVQRSGFPEAYADHEDEARAWARAFTGDTAAVVTCAFTGGVTTSAQDFAARVDADLGGSYTVDALGLQGPESMLGVRPLEVSEQTFHALQSWAVATASTTGVIWVDNRGALWLPTGAYAVGEPTPASAAYPGIRLAVATG